MTLRNARRRAGFTQRDLAREAGVPQSTIARLEAGAVTPRVDSLQHLLRACGERLEARPRRGAEIDRSLIREMLRMKPIQRLQRASAEANSLNALLEKVR